MKRISLIHLSFVLFCSTAFGEAKLSTAQRVQRLSHAHELLGKYYKHSAVRAGERVHKIKSSIYHWTKERLPKAYRKKYQAVAQTVIDEANKYGFDPVFLMSVIQSESSFNPTQIGGVGEIGLMQIRPQTGKWMAEMMGMPWKGDATLMDPVTNIKIGAAYLSYLRDRFDMHARLYLAAYNMGSRRVATVLERRIWPKDYPIQVMRNYVEFYSALVG
jgi:soluble lytic murein transglycosylase